MIGPVDMQVQIIVILVCHLAFGLAVDAFRPNMYALYGNRFNISLPAPLNTSGTLLPAYHRNVTAGAAWVMPASTFELGARAMSCECFDPDETCCMPSSSDIAPFCINKGATCCADTLCDPGETCCGDYCCRSDTNCSTDPNNPGCCLKGQSCNSQSHASCIDASSPNCTNTVSPPEQCCPSSIPYCRTYETVGLGCFGVPTNSSSIPKATSQPTAAATAYNGTTTLVETVSVKFLSTSALSLQFPETITLASNLAGWSISTTYVFRFSSTIFEATPSTSSILATSSTPPSPLSTASSSTSTERSTLCFDPNLQSPVPCTSPPMPSSLRSSSSSSAPPPYPAATTLHSSANHSTHALNIYYIISSLTLMYLFIRLDFPYKFYIAILWILNAAFRAWMKYRAYVNAHRQEEIDALAAKYGVERQASEKGFWTQIGEVAAYAVVMPVTVGWETVKRIWADWVSEN